MTVMTRKDLLKPPQLEGQLVPDHFLSVTIFFNDNCEDSKNQYYNYEDSKTNYDTCEGDNYLDDNYEDSKNSDENG